MLGGGGEGEKGLLYISMSQVDVKQWQSPLSFYACFFCFNYMLFCSSVINSSPRWGQTS